VLRIFLRVIAQTLQTHSPGAAQTDKAVSHFGAMAVIDRFGSSLNEHVQFHVCVVDGVFEAAESGVIFHLAMGIDVDARALVQASLRNRILRAFVGRGLPQSFDAKQMLGYRQLRVLASSQPQRRRRMAHLVGPALG
jgi:Putative transposase